MLCPICVKEAKQVCSACRNVAYCSQAHQKCHWKEHKQQCRIFIIKKDERYGRYLVASRDISPGTIIMDEYPIIVGPKQETTPICLGCHRKINQPSIYYCSKCKTFPVCGTSCETIPFHAENECKIYAKYKAPFNINSVEVRHSAYESVLTIRLLMLKKHNPKKWKQLIAMGSQNEIRKASIPEVWHRNQINTVDLLRCHFGMKDEFSDLEIHSVIGYTDINSFEIKSKTLEICGLYDNAYLMAHDCVSNPHHSIGNDFRMIVRASVPIKQGEIISTIYTHTLVGTLERRQNLRESKFFDCVCNRCLDSTELDTYISAIKCTNCSCGYHLPIDPLQANSEWACSQCPLKVSASFVTSMLTNLKLEIDDLNEELRLSGGDAIPKMENFIAKHSGKTLHENHYLLIILIHSLSQLYGRVKGWYVDDLTRDILMKKKQHCLHLLKIIDVIDSGMSRLRGLTLYELHAAIFFIAKYDFELKQIDATELKRNLEEFGRANFMLLKSAEEILNFDPPESNEGVIAKSIPESIDGVNIVMNNFC